MNRTVTVKAKSSKAKNRLANTMDGNPSGQNIESLIEQIELWLPRSQSAEGTQSVYTEVAVEAHNELLQKIKSKLRNKK